MPRRAGGVGVRRANAIETVQKAASESVITSSGLDSEAGGDERGGRTWVCRWGGCEKSLKSEGRFERGRDSRLSGTPIERQKNTEGTHALGKTRAKTETGTLEFEGPGGGNLTSEDLDAVILRTT